MGGVNRHVEELSDLPTPLCGGCVEDGEEKMKSPSVRVRADLLDDFDDVRDGVAWL